MLIGIAQVNPLVGDINANKSLMLEYIKAGKSKYNIDTIVFPELMLTGYPPEDLLYRPDFHEQINHAIKSILKHTKDINLIFGYPRHAGNNLHNSCAYISKGKFVTSYDKMILPNYGVFDEIRYFKPGAKPCLINLNGINTALSICEDIWSPEPLSLAAAEKADLVININASPFHINKLNQRKKILQLRIKETGLPIIYVNLTGGQDELVFDGGSMVIDFKGKVIMQAPQFEEGLYILDVIKNTGSKVTFVGTKPVPTDCAEEEIIYNALVMAVRDYVNKNGFNGVVIGLSGGIDSALVTCIATDALGTDNVEAILMPSQYTAAMSVDDSVQLAINLHIKYQILSIESPFTAFKELLGPAFKDLPADTTEENIQARCRGVILMALSNKSHRLVLATANKSEMAVGYATLYGDMVGGYAPLKDVPKLLVYRLAKWKNRESELIPERIINRPPSAELRENQKDEDSLPAYDVLDPILERYIERDQNPQQIIENGFDRQDVLLVTRLVDQSEYKRRQAAPGVKISKRAFGRERRYPITSGYREK
jgi:NAD+ synthase (glutamine-hydrolysing)